MNIATLGFSEIDHGKLKRAKTPYKIYAELLDASSQEQFYNVLNEPYVNYAALMPDAHAGYTMPIGGVCAAKGKVVPQFVGFDIGCGMCAYKTEYTKEDVKKHAETIYQAIVTRIPLGFQTHKNHQSLKLDLPKTALAESLLQSIGLKQIGTLGGGNHFIEIGYGRDEMAWIVIHSGSRGFGHKIASHYIYQAYLNEGSVEDRLAATIADFEARNAGFKAHNPEGYQKSLEKFKNKQMLKQTQKANLDNLEGIYALDVDSKLGQEYIMDQNFALAFALENRKRMIEVIHDVMQETLGSSAAVAHEDETRFINRNHNHAEYNTDMDAWIHRKGATHAEAGMRGVIPGNMRDGSFIVKGKGNTEALCSSSHGAGRVMSRNKANALVTLEQFEASMTGITATVAANTIDESPFAYKDIFEVMALQESLVEVEEHIKVLINVKDSQSYRKK
jgi:tRNA-splicing ligase RtcB